VSSFLIYDSLSTLEVDRTKTSVPHLSQAIPPNIAANAAVFITTLRLSRDVNMASSQGFSIIEKAVSQELVQKLVDELRKDLPARVPTAQREKYNEYEVPPLGFDVKDDFVKNTDKSKVTELLQKPVPPSPESIHIGIFHTTDANPLKLKTAGENRVYVTIALTDLGPSNGWFTFFEGSHRERTQLGRKVALDLKAGDAVVWRGGLVYHDTPGGGGMFETLVYR